MKIWVTKRALTVGVEEVEADTEWQALQSCGAHTIVDYSLIGLGEYWFYTRAEAVIRAKQMHAKRIKSVLKYLARLESMKFD